MAMASCSFITRKNQPRPALLQHLHPNQPPMSLTPRAQRARWCPVSRSRFGNDTALTCVRSALLLLAVLPDEPDEGWFYTISPWWTMLHCIIQATAVLLIHLTVGSVPMKTEPGHEKQPKRPPYFTSTVLSSCKKAIRWLHHMANHDLACKRGFELSINFLRRIASSKNLDLEGVSLPAPSPPDESSGSRRSYTPQLASASSNHENFGGSTLMTLGSGMTWPGELFPLSLAEEPDMAWFLSIADLPEPHNT